MSGADRTAKVGVKLTVDDRTAAATARIKRSFESVREKIHGATSALGGFVSQSLAMAGGLSIDRAIRGMASLAANTLREAELANNAKRSIAGLFSATSGLAYGSVYKAASGVNDQLELMGVRAGVSADSVVDSFRTMYGFVSRTGGGIDDTVGLVGDLTAISGAMSIPMQDLSSSAMGISVGMVRARDPLVQMMRTFGGIDVMSDSFKKLSESAKMQKMMDALSLIGDKFRGVPPGFTQLKQGLSDLWADVKESFGVPIVEKLNTALLQLRNYWVRNKEEIEAWVTTWGEKAAELVQSAAQSAVKAFRWVQGHWQDIVEQVKRIPYYLAGGMVARSAASGTMGLISTLMNAGVTGLAARGGRGAAVATKAASGTARTVAAMVPGMVGAFGVALPTTLRAAPAMTGLASAAPAAGAVAGGGPVMWAVAAAGLAALAAAITMVGLAAYAFSKNLNGLGDRFRALVGTTDDLFSSTSQLGMAFSNLWEVSQPLVEVLAIISGEMVLSGLQNMVGLIHAMAWALKKLMNLPGAGLLIAAAGVSGIGGSGAAPSEDPEIERATLAGLGAAARHRSRVAREERERGDRALIDQAAQRGLRGAPTIDARGSTFNIKQDFRDEDPDRIASIFTRDITRAAEARVTARTSTPFGP